MNENERLYISGPITGVIDYEKIFAKAESKLVNMGYNTINPAPLYLVLPGNASYEEYMSVDFHLIDMADAICLLDGWEQSNGAKREYEYAVARGKKIYRFKEIAS